MPWFSKRYLSLRLPHQTLYAIIFSSICVTCPASLILSDLFTQLIFGEVCTYYEDSHYAILSNQ